MRPPSSLRRAFTLVVTLTLGLSLVGPTNQAFGRSGQTTATAAPLTTPAAPLTNLACLRSREMSRWA